MAKIIKHTFKMPKLEVVDGDLIQNGYLEETHTFTLLHKGMGLFEEQAGKPLMACLVELDIDFDDLNKGINSDTVSKLLSRNFLNNLACASYVKIEDNKFHNNRATFEEFKKTGAYQVLGEDFEFIIDLLSMATDCLIEEKKGEQKTKVKTKSKKV